MLTRTAAVLLAFVGTVATATLPGVALAADIPASIRTKATLKVTSTYTPGLFESEDDTDWYRVTLKAGEDYGVSGESSGGYGMRLRLRDAKGKLLPPAAVLVDGYTDVGFEFRPAKDGTYFIETLYLQDQSFRYNVRVAPDCRADKTTRCTLKPGVTQQRITAWAYDTDWFKAQLTRGKTYAVGIESSSGTVEIVNGDGAVLAVGSQKFTPSSTGAYFVRVRTGNDTGETYRVTLSLD